MNTLLSHSKKKKKGKKRKTQKILKLFRRKISEFHNGESTTVDVKGKKGR